MVDIIEISKSSSPASSTSSGPFSFAPVSNPYNSATRKRIKKRVEMQSIELLDDKSEATSTFLTGVFVGRTATVLQAESNKIVPRVKTQTILFRCIILILNNLQY